MLLDPEQPAELGVLGTQQSGRCRWPEELDNKLVVTMVTKYDLSPLGPKGWTDVTPIAGWGGRGGEGQRYPLHWLPPNSDGDASQLSKKTVP